jgi:hypothetical protein
MTINILVGELKQIGEARELKEFIYAARDCLDGTDFQPDERLKCAFKQLENCGGPTLMFYGHILRQMAEQRPYSAMNRICALYMNTLKDRLIPF